MALALLQISAPQAKTRAISNPEIIFPDEAVQIIVKNNLGFNRGETKMLYNDNWVSAHNGGSEQPYLYDDGTHGDNIAGDGLYTNNCMALSRVPNFFNKPHQFNGDVHILDPKLKESVEIYHISENTWTTDKSMFMNIGYDYTQYENNNYPIVFSPNLDSQVYRKVFELFDDNINIVNSAARYGIKKSVHVTEPTNNNSVIYESNAKMQIRKLADLIRAD